MVRHFTRHHESANQINPQCAEPNVFGEGVEFIVGDKGGGARIVHQHIELPKVLYRRCDESLAVGLLRDVRLHSQRVTTCIANMRNNRLRSLYGAAVVHHHPRAHLGKFGRQRGTHARTGASNQYDTACYIHFHYAPLILPNAEKCIGWAPLRHPF